MRPNNEFILRLVLIGNNLSTAKNKVEVDLWSTVKANWSVWGPGTGFRVPLIKGSLSSLRRASIKPCKSTTCKLLFYSGGFSGGNNSSNGTILEYIYELESKSKV